ncbi:MAG: UvrD-helicase domain-containing protein [Legionella sp.]|nr:UvrD-helicase domain-containing protein [Legionella sp.]
MMVSDQAARQEATNPFGSYIVQAPAGSGKTELLTQRYLRLLSTVNAPEQIVALTFTRKAASEMRERILRALTHAHQQLPATSPHQQLTNQYAIDALQRCKALNWQLLKQPGRLKIITIDSLCQTLTHAIPLHEQQIPYADIADSPQSLYRLAVRACINDALEQEPLQPAIELLLEHLDNRQDKLLDLLCNLLSMREQWLSLLYSARAQTRETCEEALLFIEQHELERLRLCIPQNLQEELFALSRKVASIESNRDSLRYHLTDWHHFDELTREVASGLAALLLTKDDSIRKSFDHNVGLRSDSCEKSLYKSLKARSKELLSELDDNPDFIKALLRVKNLPAPFYDDSQWNVLQALLTLLPMLAAHLHLVFCEANKVDFTAISEQALFALGNEDSPTDLALYLDNAIHHLLVDEFQDTSIQQFQLLTKLVQGWLANDGKTLFVVGDPMQSIYRFRQAEVGLFLKAQKEGIGAIQLTPLELSTNFRSTPTIVNWVNSQFKTIFPAHDDMQSGAISFHSSIANLSATDDSGVFAKFCDSKHQEAQALVELVALELQNYPNQDIAILVRSRNQLSSLIPLLRAKNIPFQGVEIEKLSNMPHLIDIWSIIKALLMPANRLPWLALLRSPWCGLCLSDLHCIANFDKKKSIYFALSQLRKITGLSAEGLMRAEFIYKVMHEAIATRHQQPLTDWIITVIKQLHGESILEKAQRDDLEQFFVLLNRYTIDGQIADFEQFEKEYERLYSERVTQARLQIMTIHKSKGLEFDCVILPGLGSKPQQRDKPLLRWLKLPRQYQEDFLLLSPIYAAHQKSCLLYKYLGEINADKESYEQQRLLYVAATRAKKRLYLFDADEKISSGTFRELLKNVDFSPVEMPDKTNESTPALPVLTRLPLHYYSGPATISAPQTTASTPLLIPSTARLTGIVAHELLQWICDMHPQKIDELPWGMVANRFKSLGFTLTEQEHALATLHAQISTLFCNPVGLWLCQKHSDEKNEYELLVQENGKACTKIIDRTFCSEGVRWIIDFKTGTDDDKAQKNHRVQVNGYATLLAEQNNLPIRCGLFYLATNLWVNWEYKEVKAELCLPT